MHNFFNIQRAATLIASTLVFATLSACGGGGSGGTGTTTTTSGSATIVGTPTIVADRLVTTVPTPTYAAASEELAAFNYINAERERCGFGKLAQNTRLDAAAGAHGNWMMLNQQIAHEESRTYPNGFTGIQPGDRAIAAGYSSDVVGENISARFSSPILALTGYGLESVKGLATAPYHLFGMMASYKDIGIAVLSGGPGRVGAINGVDSVAVYNFGVAANANGQILDDGAVATYPCEGVIGVNFRLRGESPNPVPGRDLAVNPIGTPVLVMVRMGNVLTITSATMTNLSNGSAVTMRTPITGANDPNGRFGQNGRNGKYAGYVAPDVALTPNTRYQATVTGTNNGAAFSRTFVFATGAGG